MRFPGIALGAASRPRARDEVDPRDYNGCPCRKSLFRSSFCLHECGNHRNPFCSLLADRKPAPQPTRIRSPDKTERTRPVEALPFPRRSVPPHPGIFGNFAYYHLIPVYSVAPHCVSVRLLFQRLGRVFTGRLKNRYICDTISSTSLNLTRRLFL